MRFLQILLKLLLLINLFLFAGLGYHKWSELSPRLATIQSKNPERYELMVVLAKGFEFRRAKKIFEELEAMTTDEVVILRFNKLQKAWEESEDYRQKKLHGEDQTRKEQRLRNQQSYELRTKEALENSPQQRAQWVLNNWAKTSSWNKALILRQKCSEVIRREIRLEKIRKEARTLPRTAPYIAPRRNIIIPSKLCESWVPLNENEDSIRQAIKNLRDHLEFLQFKKLLNDIGIPESKVMDFEKQTERFTADYSGA